jgi:hypothetical protein
MKYMHCQQGKNTKFRRDCVCKFVFLCVSRGEVQELAKYQTAAHICYLYFMLINSLRQMHEPLQD